jgi:hypothetical protein
MINGIDFATRNMHSKQPGIDAELKKGNTRNTLRRELDPVPTNYCVDVPPSMMPTPSPPARKPQSVHTNQTN